MASRKSSAGAVSAQSIQKVLREAKPVADEAKAVSLPKSIPDFCKSWNTQIRGILLAIIGFLKLFKPKWAETLAAVVAFIDGICAQ